MVSIELDSHRNLVLCRDLSDRPWVFRHCGQEGHSAAFDVEDTHDAVVITTQLAGLTADDLDIEVTDNTLTIETQHELEDDTEGGTYVVRRRHDPFGLSVALPRDVRTNEIEASYADGVLTVRVPTARERKPRRLAVRCAVAQKAKLAV